MPLSCLTQFPIPASGKRRGLYHPAVFIRISPRRIFVERFERVKAREILRSLIAAHGKSRIWYLMCGVRQDESSTKRYSCALCGLAETHPLSSSTRS